MESKESKLGKQFNGTLRDPGHSYTVIEVVSSERPLTKGDFSDFFPRGTEWNFIRDRSQVIYFACSTMDLMDIGFRLLKSTSVPTDIGVVHTEIDVTNLELSDQKVWVKMDIAQRESVSKSKLIMDPDQGKAFGECHSWINIEAHEEFISVSVHFNTLQEWLRQAAHKWFEVSKFYLNKSKVVYKMVGHNFAPTLNMLRNALGGDIQIYPQNLITKQPHFTALAFQNDNKTKLPYGVQVLKAHTRSRGLSVTLVDCEFDLKDPISTRWHLKRNKRHHVLCDGQTFQGNVIPRIASQAAIALELLHLGDKDKSSRASFVSWLPDSKGWLESALSCTKDPENEFFKCFSKRVDSVFSMSPSNELVSALRDCLPQIYVNVSDLPCEWKTLTFPSKTQTSTHEFKVSKMLSTPAEELDANNHVPERVQSQAVRQNEMVSVEQSFLCQTFLCLAHELCNWIGQKSKRRVSMKLRNTFCQGREIVDMIFHEDKTFLWFVRQYPALFTISDNLKFVASMAVVPNGSLITDEDILVATGNDLTRFVVDECRGRMPLGDIATFFLKNSQAEIVLSPVSRLKEIIEIYTDLVLDNHILRAASASLSETHLNVTNVDEGDNDVSFAFRDRDFTAHELLQWISSQSRRPIHVSQMEPFYTKVPSARIYQKDLKSFLESYSELFDFDQDFVSIKKRESSSEELVKDFCDWVSREKSGEIDLKDAANVLASYPGSRSFLPILLECWACQHRELFKVGEQHISLTGKIKPVIGTYDKSSTFHVDINGNTNPRAPVVSDSIWANAADSIRAINGFSAGKAADIDESYADSVIPLIPEKLETDAAEKLSNWIQERHDGSIRCHEMGNFYIEYPDAEKLIRKKLKNFVERHSKYLKYDRTTCSITCTKTRSPVSDERETDAAEKLSNWIQERHDGSIRCHEMGNFYIEYPDAEKHIRKKLKSFVERHSKYLKYDRTTCSISCTKTRSPVSDELETDAAEKLSNWIHERHDGSMHCGQMGSFYVEYPDAGKYMRNKFKSFVERHSKYLKYDQTTCSISCTKTRSPVSDERETDAAEKL